MDIEAFLLALKLGFPSDIFVLKIRLSSSHLWYIKSNFEADEPMEEIRSIFGSEIIHPFGFINKEPLFITNNGFIRGNGTYEYLGNMWQKVEGFFRYSGDRKIFISKRLRDWEEIAKIAKQYAVVLLLSVSPRDNKIYQ